MRVRVVSPGRNQSNLEVNPTTVETTAYNNSRSQPVKQPQLIANGRVSPEVCGARKSFPLAPIDNLIMLSVTDNIHEFEKCHCVRPKGSDKKVRFMDMLPTDLADDCRGDESKVELHILTPKLKGNTSIVSAPEWQDIEVTVDSGACDTVMPTKMSAHISIVATAKSRSEFGYEVAIGDGLLNVGSDAAA